MSTWDDITKEFGSDIGSAADEYIKATNILPYTVDEIKDVFTSEQMDEVASFIKEMREAKNDNAKKAKTINRSVTIVEGLLKLGKFLV